MDGKGDNLSKKGKEIGESPVPGTRYIAGKKYGRHVAKDSSFFAEQRVIIAQKKVDRAKKRLKIAQDIKDSTSRNLERQSTRNNVGYIETMERLRSIVKKRDDHAAKSLLFAKERLKRLEESLKKIQINIRK